VPMPVVYRGKAGAKASGFPLILGRHCPGSYF
jgi:hypothetical protein